MRITTTRLLIRKFKVDDAPFMLNLLNDPGWIKNIGDRGVRTLHDCELYIQDRIIRPYKEQGFGMYLVALRDGQKEGLSLGSCGLVKRQGLDHVDIGFAFLEAHCGQGYGSESAQAIVGKAKTAFGLSKLVGITTEVNIPSQKLLIKLGMHYHSTITIPNIPGVSKYFEMDL